MNETEGYTRATDSAFARGLSGRPTGSLRDPPEVESMEMRI